jgi:hypothetical protein
LLLCWQKQEKSKQKLWPAKGIWNWFKGIGDSAEEDQQQIEAVAKSGPVFKI